MEVLRIDRGGDPLAVRLRLPDEPEARLGMGVEQMKPGAGLALKLEQDGDRSAPDDVARVDLAECADVARGAGIELDLAEVVHQGLGVGMHDARQAGIGDRGKCGE